jgi:hypothetical protein
MKSLRKDIKRSFMMTFLLSFLLFDTALYIVLEDKTPFLFMLGLTLLLLLAVYYVADRFSKKINSDVAALNAYAKDISEHKKYRSSIKIEYFLEILESAIYLKNIAKRLSQKEKKSSKK